MKAIRREWGVGGGVGGELGGGWGGVGGGRGVTAPVALIDTFNIKVVTERKCTVSELR